MLLLDSLRSLVPSALGRSQYGYFSQKCPDESSSSDFCTTNPDGRSTPTSCANSLAHLFWRRIFLGFHVPNSTYSINPPIPRRNMSSPIRKNIVIASKIPSPFYVPYPMQTCGLGFPVIWRRAGSGPALYWLESDHHGSALHLMLESLRGPDSILPVLHPIDIPFGSTEGIRRYTGKQLPQDVGYKIGIFDGAAL